MIMLKMYGPQIQICLLTFRPFTLKQLISLTKTDTFSWLGGPGVTYPPLVQKLRGLIPSFGKDFYV